MSSHTEKAVKKNQISALRASTIGGSYIDSEIVYYFFHWRFRTSDIISQNTAGYTANEQLLRIVTKWLIFIYK